MISCLEPLCAGPSSWGEIRKAAKQDYMVKSVSFDDCKQQVCFSQRGVSIAVDLPPVSHSVEHHVPVHDVVTNPVGPDLQTPLADPLPFEFLDPGGADRWDSRSHWKLGVRRTTKRAGI